MTQQHIKLGSQSDGRDGDTNRAAWEKKEAYFNELYGGALSISPFKNVLINGNFDIWQRGQSLGPSIGPRYLADRWLTWAWKRRPLPQAAKHLHLANPQCPMGPGRSTA